jgi:hypothetical protein
MFHFEVLINADVSKLPGGVPSCLGYASEWAADRLKLVLATVFL